MTTVTSLPDQPARSGRILLVEDEPLVRMTAVDQLESFGFTVETAGSASEAMSQLKLTGDFEAAIIDVGLPDRKGDVLVVDVRALYPAMAIVIATGYGGDVLRRRFEGDGRVAVLGKPYMEEDLRRALASLNVVGQ